MGITDTLPGNCMIISRSIFLSMRNISDKICKGKSKQILCPITIFRNGAVYDIVRKKLVQLDRPRMAM